MSRQIVPRRVSGVHAPGGRPAANDETTAVASALFDQFCAAHTFAGITSTFQQLCDVLELKPSDHHNFYHHLKARLTSWKAQNLWTKLDKRCSQREYKKGKACSNTRCLIIGAGPCGLRVAIEVAFLGGKAVIVEKRDRFSRNNVLHLWPFLIHDLKALGAKKFFGKFCTGAVDHISIRSLQCILLKVALLLGVEIHGNVSFEELVEPPEEQSNEKVGWRASVTPADHPISEYEFDVLIGADGKRNTLKGFKRKEFRGKLAIAITANFINKNTNAEARVEEISGVAFIFNQKFFKDLNEKTGIDLENIVYYKDETHYFVMTAKKQSLLNKGVLIYDYMDTARLLSQDNVNQQALLNYAREAADVSTRHQLPHLDYAHNHYGQPDVAMFDFTSIYAAEHASRVVERRGHKLLMGLCGDSLIEPFWPTGSGCARGFLGALDLAWTVRNWASGRFTSLEVMAQRESVYQLLSQTTPENLNKHFHMYTIDPSTRYPNVNMNYFKPFQVKHQFDCDDEKYRDEIVQISEQKSKRYEWIRDSHYLYNWFARQLESYRNVVKITDLTTSWRNGLALCALIHKYRPELVDFYKLDANEVAKNNQLAFDIAEKEFGISPVMSGSDVAACEVPDKLTMVSYLSQFYDYLRKENMRPTAKNARTPKQLAVPRGGRGARPRSPAQRLSFLTRINNRMRTRKPMAADQLSSDEEEDANEPRSQLTFTQGFTRKRVHGESAEGPDSQKVVLQGYNRLEGRRLAAEPLLKQTRAAAAAAHTPPGGRTKNKVTQMAKGLAGRLKGSEQLAQERRQQAAAKPLIMGQAASADMCYFCQKRVYVVERHSAEGVFFHRGCLKCEFCGTNLRIGQYGFQRGESGEARFFCIQHIGFERPIRRTRKRSFPDRDALAAAEESDEEYNYHETPDDFDEVAFLPPGGGFEAAPARPEFLSEPFEADVDSVLSQHGAVGGALDKTPERIEYYTESEVEESELEQTQHNLSGSLLEVGPASSGSESEDSSDELAWSEGELSEGNEAWAQLAVSYNKLTRMRKPSADPQARKAARRAAAAKAAEGSDSDTEELASSDEDWESESETEKESEGEDSDDGRRYRNIRQEDGPPAVIPFQYYEEPVYSTRRSPQGQPHSPIEYEDKQPSPAASAILKNRMSFFSAVAEPVRIDPFSFLGLSPAPNIAQGDKALEPQPKEPEEEVEEEEEAAVELAEGEHRKEEEEEEKAVGEEKDVKEERLEDEDETDSSLTDTETITEGSESESDGKTGVVCKVHHPIPTISIEEVDLVELRSDEEAADLPPDEEEGDRDIKAEAQPEEPAHDEAKVSVAPELENVSQEPLTGAEAEGPKRDQEATVKEAEKLPEVDQGTTIAGPEFEDMMSKAGQEVNIDAEKPIELRTEVTEEEIVSKAETAELQAKAEVTVPEVCDVRDEVRETRQEIIERPEEIVTVEEEELVSRSEIPEPREVEGIAVAREEGIVIETEIPEPTEEVAIVHEGVILTGPEITVPREEVAIVEEGRILTGPEIAIPTEEVERIAVTEEDVVTRPEILEQAMHVKTEIPVEQERDVPPPEIAEPKVQTDQLLTAAEENGPAGTVVNAMEGQVQQQQEQQRQEEDVEEGLRRDDEALQKELDLMELEVEMMKQSVGDRIVELAKSGVLGEVVEEMEEEEQPGHVGVIEMEVVVPKQAPCVETGLEMTEAGNMEKPDSSELSKVINDLQNVGVPTVDKESQLEDMEAVTYQTERADAKPLSPEEELIYASSAATAETLNPDVEQLPAWKLMAALEKEQQLQVGEQREEQPPVMMQIEQDQPQQKVPDQGVSMPDQLSSSELESLDSIESTVRQGQQPPPDLTAVTPVTRAAAATSREDRAVRPASIVSRDTGGQQEVLAPIASIAEMGMAPDLDELTPVATDDHMMKFKEEVAQLQTYEPDLLTLDISDKLELTPGAPLAASSPALAQDAVVPEAEAQLEAEMVLQERPAPHQDVLPTDARISDAAQTTPTPVLQATEPNRDVALQDTPRDVPESKLPAEGVIVKEKEAQASAKAAPAIRQPASKKSMNLKEQMLAEKEEQARRKAAEQRKRDQEEKLKRETEEKKKRELAERQRKAQIRVQELRKKQMLEREKLKKEKNAENENIEKKGEKIEKKATVKTKDGREKPHRSKEVEAIQKVISPTSAAKKPAFIPPPKIRPLSIPHDVPLAEAAAAAARARLTGCPLTASMKDRKQKDKETLRRQVEEQRKAKLLREQAKKKEEEAKKRLEEEAARKRRIQEAKRAEEEQDRLRKLQEEEARRLREEKKQAKPPQIKKLDRWKQEDAMKRIDNLLEDLRGQPQHKGDTLTKFGKTQTEEISLLAQKLMATEYQPQAEGEIISDKVDLLEKTSNDRRPEVIVSAETDLMLEKPFNIDERFITTRDKRKRKRNLSNVSDSSLTTSTPSGSVRSISSVSEVGSVPNSVSEQSGSAPNSVSELGGSAPTSVSELGGSAPNMVVSSELGGGSSVSAPTSTADTGSLDILATTSESLGENISLDGLLDQTKDELYEEEEAEAEECVAYVVEERLNVGHVDITLTPLTAESSKADETPSLHTAESSTAEDSRYYTPDVSSSDVVDSAGGGVDSATTAGGVVVGGGGGGDGDSAHPMDAASNTSSDHKSVDSLDTERSSSPLSPGKVTDAKRKFFCELPQPVRIDPKRLFTDLRSPQGKKSMKKTLEAGVEAARAAEKARDAAAAAAQPEKMKEWKSMDAGGGEQGRGGGGGGVSSTNAAKTRGLELRRDWQSMDSSTGETLSPTAGVPKTNIVNGEADIFYTPLTSTKSRPAALEETPKGGGAFKKPAPARRLLPDEQENVPPKTAASATAEEFRQRKDLEREKARLEARQRARMLSDEELGIEEVVAPPRKVITRSDSQPESTMGSTKAVVVGQLPAGAGEPRQVRRQVSEPAGPPAAAAAAAAAGGQQVGEGAVRGPGGSRVVGAAAAAEGSTRATFSDGVSDHSESSPAQARRDAIKEKTKSLDRDKTKRRTLNTPKLDDEKGTDKKEKRRSFLAMLLPRKDKSKEKVSSPDVKSPKNEKKEKEKEKKTPLEKKPAAKLRSRLRPKSAEKEKEMNRSSTYAADEFNPFFEDAYGMEVKEKNKLKEKLDQVAPVAAFTPPEARIAPRATVEEFDTESELGDDRMSLRSFQSQILSTEEDKARSVRKQQKAAVRRHREQELKRLRMAQEIQRQLEEVEIKQRQVEMKGIAIERALRGEGPDAARNESDLMQEWFNVVHEKNMLVRYESELMVQARELELEDRHSRLEQQLRDRMSITEDEMTPVQREEEQRILEELLEVVEQRDSLVALLEEDRLREKEEDRDLKQMMRQKGFELSPLTYMTQYRLPSLRTLDHSP